MDLDLEPERYKHFYLNEVPDRYRSALDVRRFSTGERVVFLPYSDETYAKTQAWIHERGIFDTPDSTEAAALPMKNGQAAVSPEGGLRYVAAGAEEAVDLARNLRMGPNTWALQKKRSWLAQVSPLLAKWDDGDMRLTSRPPSSRAAALFTSVALHRAHGFVKNRAPRDARRAAAEWCDRRRAFWQNEARSKTSTISAMAVPDRCRACGHPSAFACGLRRACRAVSSTVVDKWPLAACTVISSRYKLVS